MIARALARLGAEQLLAPLVPATETSKPEAEPNQLDTEASVALITLCQNNRLSPILGDAVQSGRIVLAEDSLPKLFTSIEHFLASQLRVEQQSMTVVDALMDAAIDFRVLKGLATGYLDYPNPAMRPIGDLDILIRPSDMPEALAAISLIESGSLHALPSDDWRVTHAVPFRVGDIEIDLHHRLLHQAAGHCAARLDLFADPDPYKIAGREVFGLPPWLRLLQASAQNVLGGYQQLSSDLDVSRLAGHIDLALKHATQIGLQWVVAEGTRNSMQTLGWGERRDVGASPGWRDRAFERVYGSGTPSVQAASLLEISVAPMTIRAALARSVVLPGDAYLESRGRSPREQIVRQIKRIRPKRR
ncbi:MAG: nucleotidyltransferase family protein [Acidimicrobiia bacterium]|nr:nucleotidyltransferase family protein [Acidimicrobiia bacterium]